MCIVSSSANTGNLLIPDHNIWMPVFDANKWQVGENDKILTTEYNIFFHRFEVKQVSSLQT